MHEPKHESVNEFKHEFSTAAPLHDPVLIPGRAPARHALRFLAAAACLLAACSDGTDRSSQSGFAPGSIQQNPDPDADSILFRVDSNYGGSATSVQLLSVFWGRLVDVQDVTGTPVARDLVIGSSLGSSSAYIFTPNPITERTTVTVRYPLGSAEFDEAFRALSDEANLVLVSDAGLNPVLTIPFVPRNGALLLQFNDLLDPQTINGLTVRVTSGYPPITPYLARVVPDPNHGDLADFDGLEGLEYYPTRIVLDSTVSGAESQGTNLPVNSLGFPPSLTLGQSNLQIRIPTRPDAEFNQSVVLQNLTAHRVSTSGSGTYDADSPTRDIARSLRSGGPSDLTDDANNGFLPDQDSPSVLGTQPVVLSTLIEAVPDEPGLFRTSLDYAFAPCASGLRQGDVLSQNVGGCVVFGVIACPPGLTCLPDEVVTGGVIGSTVSDVYFRYVPSGDAACATAVFQGGAIGQVGIRYASKIHNGREACFVSFSSIGLPPSTSVSPDATISVRFTEPMDPASLRAFDTFFLTKVAMDPTYSDYIVGRVSGSPDLRTFTFRPNLPLRHTTGSQESYFLNMRQPQGDQDGVRDLAGNGLAESIGGIEFRLDPSAQTQRTNGFVFRFDSQDMIQAPPEHLNNPEFRGQFLIDGLAEIVRPRPVSRIQAAADRTQAVPSVMAPFPQGVQTPISRYGSKLQTIWRYCDVGFGLTDEQFYNVDIEHLYLAPAGGQVIADNIPRFEIGLSHCKFLPDESLDPNLLPLYPNSGVLNTYADNRLDNTNDPAVTVHPGTGGLQGFVIQPVNATITSTGTIVLPMPLNFGIMPSAFTYWTWRDTAKLTRAGGTGGPGAELRIVNLTTGTGTIGQPYGPNNVPTVGLPILLEFRCYPDDGIVGQNAWDISLATASSARPNFRAFSTGGFNTSGIAVTKNPDLENVATGGFNPTSTPTPGATTLPVDNSFYLGAMDLVVRVNRMHSIWFDTTSSGVRYQEPVIEPPASEQPSGTQVEVAFRGASTVTNAGIKSNADNIDAYGQATTTPGPTFFNNDSNWKSTMAAISSPDGVQQGARLFQVRVTFVSNAATNLSPVMSALAFAWRD
jgi:hypothetical protein